MLQPLADELPTDDEGEMAAGREMVWAEVRRMLFTGTSLHYVCLACFVLLALFGWLASFCLHCLAC